MAPTEASILSNFLLPPAPLPAFMTLRQFTELFPRALQSEPEIKVLYRELQHQRAIDADDVKRNIAAEVNRGEKQRRATFNSRQKFDQVDIPELGGQEIHGEAELFGPSQNHTPRDAHTIHTVVPEIERASAELESQIATMEAESDALLAEIQTSVGDLSDLRYGRFTKTPGAREDISEDVLVTLKRLVAACDAAKNG
ncbi:uncharacterized protein BDZ99DRAFT_398880 [Mytilinidion resinicola]|uniref:Cnl2/NKP2 family protein n=1 Tax=Mytilinidion resinicola TaxID=574789 RepID=A0A6A6Y716_9PEZI|nr:uncharacterized protein BDZ99DRAFT_398880 [Mytilinidion resinicola]KAF2803985.1 hypothetical protein BDZ99DRAFT_398880 [Mytilinidion resinicola]